MADFPKLRTEAVVQYPAGRRSTYQTVIHTFLDGSEQRFRDRALAGREWVVMLEKLTGAEIAAMERFFAERKGRSGTFAFTDPWDDTVHPNCCFADDVMYSEYVGERDARTKLVIRRNES